MTPEEKSRQDIDRQLKQCGWLVQDYREIDIATGLGVAVREFPLANGEADYLLYVDAKAIGVVEAKRADLGQLRQGQTWDSGFQPKARSIEATFLATSRFLSVARFPR